MDFNSYVVSETKIAETLPLVPPPPYGGGGFRHIGIKRVAFTLAETLITLVIIGVIAAMTVPTLISKYQKHTYVVGLKKAYSELSNAVKMIPLTEGCPAGDYECTFGQYGGHAYDYESYKKNIANLLSKQLKHVQYYDDTCDEKYDMLNYNSPCIVLDDGMIVYVTNPNSSIFVVDVNGTKGPNKINRDIFSFELNYTSGAVIPKGHDDYPTGKSSTADYYCYDVSDKWDAYCTYHVINTGKIDY